LVSIKSGTQFLLADFDLDPIRMKHNMMDYLSHEVLHDRGSAGT
jgi:hypothetical protein